MAAHNKARTRFMWTRLVLISAGTGLITLSAANLLPAGSSALAQTPPAAAAQWRTGKTNPEPPSDHLTIGGPFVITYLGPGAEVEIAMVKNGNSYQERRGDIIGKIKTSDFRGFLFIPSGAALFSPPGHPAVVYSGYTPR